MNAIYLSSLPDTFDSIDEFLSTYIHQPFNIIVRMQWMGAFELVFPKMYKHALLSGIQELMDMGELQGEIIDNHLLVINPDDEIKRCMTIIYELQIETDPAIAQDTQLLAMYYASILDRLKWMLIEDEIDDLHIKVLSRTIFASRLGNATSEELRSLFQQFGFIDKMDYDINKKRCFIKFRYRQALDLAMKSTLKINNQPIMTRYACSFGPQDDFDYGDGYSISHIDRLSKLDKKMLITSKHGGIVDGIFRGGLIIEEPFIHAFKTQDYSPKHLFEELSRTNSMETLTDDESTWTTPTKYKNHSANTTLTILSRSLYIGNIEPSTKTELYDFFTKYATIESMEYKPGKGCCFLKLKTRAMTEYLYSKCHLQIYKKSILKIGFACGFGDKSCFDYKSGINVVPFSRLSTYEQQYVVQHRLPNPFEEPSLYNNKF